MTYKLHKLKLRDQNRLNGDDTEQNSPMPWISRILVSYSLHYEFPYYSTMVRKNQLFKNS